MYDRGAGCGPGPPCHGREAERVRRLTGLGRALGQLGGSCSKARAGRGGRADGACGAPNLSLQLTARTAAALNAATFARRADFESVRCRAMTCMRFRISGMAARRAGLSKSREAGRLESRSCSRNVARRPEKRRHCGRYCPSFAKRQPQRCGRASGSVGPTPARRSCSASRRTTSCGAPPSSGYRHRRRPRTTSTTFLSAMGVLSSSRTTTSRGAPRSR